MSAVPRDTPFVPVRTSFSDNSQLLRRMIDAAPDAMLVFDARSHVLVANTACSRLLDRRPPDLLVLNLEAIVAHGERKKVAEFCSEYFTAPQTIPLERPLRWRLQRRDGFEFNADVSVTPVRVSGKLLAIAVVRQVD